jgi:hypothetical protein
VLEPVSVGLKLAFLAVLYLFLLWIARSALKDLRRPVGAGPARAVSSPTDMPTSAPGMQRVSVEARLVVESAPGHEPGMEYDIANAATLGRGEVEIHLEDPFASTHHARVSRQGGIVVLEDLGSTNGTNLNEELLDGPRPLHPGDRIRIGDSTFMFEN